MQKFRQVIFEGEILSRGIGFGIPVFLDSENVFEENKISKEDIEKEILKFKKAVKQTKNEILQLKKNLAKDKLSITFDILNTHLEILNDPLVNKEIENRIKKDKKCIETIFNDIVLDYKNKIKDPFFKEKALDIADVFKRVLSNVKANKVEVIKNFNSKSVVLSNEIIPSKVVELDEMKISAFLSFSGSYESHAAIIARSKNIPFLSKIDVEKLKNISLRKIIVDANNGIIIVNPNKKNCEKYENLKEKMTCDNSNPQIKIQKQCNIYANISHKNELNLIANKNINGIGLLRTELFFLGNKNLPGEKVQFDTYKEIAQKLKNRPFIIRLFDLGGDKSFYSISKKNSCNFFECRGVGYLIKNKKILETQIKAILKAGHFGNIYILIPFVKDVEEILLVKKYLFKACEELNIAFSNIKIGSMIEIPAAALIIDDIIKNVDFISIGTNDLARYTLACQNIGSKQLHKALIKLIKMIVDAAKDSNKPIFLCGEMIANKKILNKLIGLGISNFSVGVKHFENFQKEI